METRKKIRFIYYIFEFNLKSIHNKDYSVVKTFKAATSVVAFFFMLRIYLLLQQNRLEKNGKF